MILSKINLFSKFIVQFYGPISQRNFLYNLGIDIRATVRQYLIFIYYMNRYVLDTCTKQNTRRTKEYFECCGKISQS